MSIEILMFGAIQDEIQGSKFQIPLGTSTRNGKML